MYDFLFYWHEVIFIIYVDDGIFASPTDAEINQGIMDIGAKFYIEDQWNLDDYIDVNIDSSQMIRSIFLNLT